MGFIIYWFTLRRSLSSGASTTSIWRMSF